MASEKKPARPTFTEEEALQFHQAGKPGKLEINPTKPMATQRDLSLAYSPGVAIPVRRIAENPDSAYDYTAKGNLVAVISNGTAILGLGDLGALASKPVMEGKAVLFKRFADVDSIDLEIDTSDIDAFVGAVRYLGPSFGGINLEDIKAPDCFVIEQRLREMMDIPVFHDDQHGTAIIAAAGLINALKITGRDLKSFKLVCNGAGAAAIACVELIKAMGVPHDNVILCDSKGVVYQGRTEGMNQWKSAHAVATKARTLADAMKGADVFFGLSIKGALSPAMVESMAKKPIIFAMANPDPGDHARGSAEGARRRHHGDGTLRLSQPDQQRPGLPVHLPRRPRRPGTDDQRADEDRRGPGPRPAGARRRSGRGGGGLSRFAPALRPRLSHPRALRSAPHLEDPAGGSESGNRIRRGQASDRGFRRLR